MAKQLEMFSAPPPDENDRIDARAAAARLREMDRDRQRRGFFRSKARRSSARTVWCPSCGAVVSVPV